MSCVVMVLLASCGEDKPPVIEIPYVPADDEVVDIDGNIYHILQIGTQTWMVENLRVERYRNGDPIPTGLADEEWESANEGAFSTYDDESANKSTYGLLYNWPAVDDSRELCPTGWHVARVDDWDQLATYLGGREIAGGKMKATGTLVAGTGLWQDPNTGATDSSGFSGLPGGRRSAVGVFSAQGSAGYWWSSGHLSANYAWYCKLNFDNDTLDRDFAGEQNGYSVRCVMD